jgi:hypothetical protein
VASAPKSAGWEQQAACRQATGIATLWLVFYLTALML